MMGVVVDHRNITDLADLLKSPFGANNPFQRARGRRKWERKNVAHLDRSQRIRNIMLARNAKFKLPDRFAASHNVCTRTSGGLRNVRRTVLRFRRMDSVTNNTLFKAWRD